MECTSSTLTYPEFISCGSRGIEVFFEGPRNNDPVGGDANVIEIEKEDLNKVRVVDISSILNGGVQRRSTRPKQISCRLLRNYQLETSFSQNKRFKNRSACSSGVITSSAALFQNEKFKNRSVCKSEIIVSPEMDKLLEKKEQSNTTNLNSLMLMSRDEAKNFQHMRNVSEKNRRAELKKDFLRLRSLIPQLKFPGTCSKIRILVATKNYCLQMHAKLVSLKRMIKVLQKQQHDLQRHLLRLKRQSK